MDNFIAVPASLIAFVCLFCFVAYQVRVILRSESIRTRLAENVEKLMVRLPFEAGRRTRLRIQCREELFRALKQFYVARDAFTDNWFLQMQQGDDPMAFANLCYRREWMAMENRMTESLERLRIAIERARRVRQDREISKFIGYAEDDYYSAYGACFIADEAFRA